MGSIKRLKQSGKWKGQTKLSKHGSGRVRRILYLAALRSIHLKTSPFGAYHQRLVARGMKKGMAVVAVMRERQSLWTMSGGQGKRFARERHHSLFTVRVFAIAWTKGLTNSMASPQKAFADRIGSGSVIGCVENLNSTCCRHTSETGPKFAVVNANQILRSLSKRGGFSKLLCHPGIGRGQSDADMDHPSRLQFDEEEPGSQNDLLLRVDELMSM